MKEPMPLTGFFPESWERVVGLNYVLLLALPFTRFMRAAVRPTAPGPAGWPEDCERSERVIWDALRRLSVERREVNRIVWHPWTHHMWRILEMLQIPIGHRFQWESG